MRVAMFLFSCAATGLALPAAAQPVAGAEEVASACGGEVDHAAFKRMSKAKQVQKLSCFNREAAKQFNKTLPKMVDQTTKLERVSAEGMILSYHYLVDLLASDLQPGAVTSFKEGVRGKVCAAPDMKAMIGIGTAYRYYWKDRLGKPIGEMTVSAC